MPRRREVMEKCAPSLLRRIRPSSSWCPRLASPRLPAAANLSPPATTLLTHRRAALLLPPLRRLCSPAPPRASAAPDSQPWSAGELHARAAPPRPWAGEVRGQASSARTAALGGPAPRASSAAPRVCSAPRSPTPAAPTLPPPLRRCGPSPAVARRGAPLLPLRRRGRSGARRGEARRGGRRGGTAAPPPRRPRGGGRWCGC